MHSLTRCGELCEYKPAETDDEVGLDRKFGAV